MLFFKAVKTKMFGLPVDGKVFLEPNQVRKRVPTVIFVMHIVICMHISNGNGLTLTGLILGVSMPVGMMSTYKAAANCCPIDSLN